MAKKIFDHENGRGQYSTFIFPKEKKPTYIKHTRISILYLLEFFFLWGKATLVYCTITRARKLILPYKNMSKERIVLVALIIT